MANRVLIGNRATGGYGIYVSRLTSDVLTCANDKLMFNTNSGETGSNFFSAGHFQVVPNAGGTSGTAPTVTSNTTVSANSTGSASYQNYASTKVLMWGISGAISTTGTYAYSSIGSTSATLTNTNANSRTVTNVAFNLLSGVALF